MHCRETRLEGHWLIVMVQCVLCSRSRWGGGCCWPSFPYRTPWWTYGGLWRAVRSTPSCLWGPRTSTGRSRYRSSFVGGVPKWDTADAKKKTEILYAESPELSKVPPFESRVAEYNHIALHPSLSARNCAHLVSAFQAHSSSVFHHSSPSPPWRTAEI